MRFRRVVIAAVPLVITGAAAMAFIAAQGHGAGHAAQGTEAATLQVGVVVPTVDFGSTGTVEVYVKNASTKVAYKPTGVTLNGPTVTPKDAAVACPAGSFVVSDVIKALPDHALAPGETAKVATAKLSFVDLPDADQKGCLGADVAETADVQ